MSFPCGTGLCEHNRLERLCDVCAEAKDKLPAIPPNDYRGTQAAWMLGLQERGLWNGEGFHGDVWLTREQYGELLDATEASR